MADNIGLSLEQVIKKKKQDNRKKIPVVQTKKKSAAATIASPIKTKIIIKKSLAKTTSTTSTKQIKTVPKTPTKLKITITNDRPVAKKKVVDTLSTLRITTTNHKAKSSGDELPRSLLSPLTLSRGSKRGGAIGGRGGRGLTSTIRIGSNSSPRGGGHRHQHEDLIDQTPLQLGGFNRGGYNNNNGGGFMSNNYNNGFGGGGQDHTMILTSRNPSHNWGGNGMGNGHHGGGGFQKSGSGLQLFTGTRVRVANLNHSVTDDDLLNIFKRKGDIKQINIQYDKSGRSNGTAIVVFAQHNNAIDAIKTFQNANLDGKPMVLQLVKE